MSSLVNENAEKILYRLHKKYLGRNIFLFAMGLLISSFAFNLFYEPYNIVPTGSSGLALIISHFTNFDVSIVTLVVCLILLLIGIIFFGYQYGLNMLIVTLLYPCFLKSTSLITRYIDLENTSIFLLMIVGGACLGFSSAIIKKSGYSAGGFTVLLDIFKKYFYWSLGKSNIIINSILVFISVFVFGLNNAIYAIVSILVSSHIVDKCMIGISNHKVFYIVSDKYSEIRDLIIGKLNYSVTLVNARGGYTNKYKKVLMCVVSTIEYVKLKELVQAIDENAFFLIIDAYDSSVKKICKKM